MIVKNEEAILSRCLDSIKDAVDEIIIIDTGSTDKTKAITEIYTDKLYDFSWIDDFSAARNEAFSKATMDYQMWLDADDVFPKESLGKLLALKSTLDPAIDIVTMKYITHFDDYGNPTLSFSRERLTRRGKGYVWQDPVHEFIQHSGNILHSDIEVHHKKEKSTISSTRNLDIYENMVKSGTALTPRQLYYYAREQKDHGLWEGAASCFEKFLDTKQGWIEDNIAACFNLAICHNSLGNREKVLPILFKSFEFDAPRAEICTEIGYWYKQAGQYAMALKWFQVGARLDLPDIQGFILLDYWGYIPNLESCVCCCYLGDYKQAEVYNEIAASFKFNAGPVEHNRRYLAEIK